MREEGFHSITKLDNKACPTDKTVKSLFVNRGQKSPPKSFFDGQNIFYKSRPERKFQKGDVQIECILCEAQTVPYSLSSLIRKQSNKNLPGKMQRQEGHAAAGNWYKAA